MEMERDRQTHREREGENDRDRQTGGLTGGQTDRGRERGGGEIESWVVGKIGLLSLVVGR